jgi:hypothetical protein
MRILIAVLVLIFSLQSLSKAEDLSGFEIEGMSIGDSLLDYMTKNQINNFEKTYYSGSKKYVRLQNNINLNNKLTTFDKLAFEVLDNDNKYILHSVNGILNYKNNIKDCYPKMEKIIDDISIILNKSVTKSYEFIYPNDRGKSQVNDFLFSDGEIRIWCTDYSKKAEKMRYHDHLGLAVGTEDHVNWVKTKAHK